MKFITKKALALVLSALLILSGSFSLFSFAVETSCGGNCSHTPAIAVPGLFQSEVKLYDEDGNVMLDSKGKERKAPFFMDTDDVVKDAIAKAVLPLAGTLITQKDEQNKLANALGDVVGEALAGRVKADSNGEFICDIRATQYTTSVAKMNSHDKAWVYDAIPLREFSSIAGEDHLYFFSYCSFDNMEKLAKQLYDLIQTVKQQTGHDKVNIVPISQGGSICNALLEYYPDVINDLERIIYIVPAIDGAAVLGDIYAYGLIDDDDALYDYLIPSLMKDDQKWIGYLADMLIRVLPKDVLNNVLDTLADKLISDYLVNSTCLWALVPQESYLIAREKYLSGDEHKVIRKQTDRYYMAQVHAKENILKAIDSGVTVFDICGYNYSMYKIVDSWNKVQADGIIQLNSSSLGAASVAVDKCLPDGYEQANTHVGTTCKDASHNHIDSYNMVDASAGLLPDNTFYFYGQNHERTGRCEIIIDLATKLLTDKNFVDVYSYKDTYPQFNNFILKESLRHYVWTASQINTANLTESEKSKLTAAVDEANEVLKMTAVDLERYTAAEINLKTIVETINQKADPEGTQEANKKNAFIDLLNKLFDFINKIIRKYFGDIGFSDKK